jgi:non-canonical purine NTP pyrophosphatase (RdgB/HAM1 family)
MLFITGNKGKFEEMRTVLPELEMRDIDLPEIQSSDAQEIIRAKLHVAFDHCRGAFIVEDTSLYFDALGGLPGPLIKWFLKAIGTQGLVDLAEKMGNPRAVAKTIIGYVKNQDEIFFFEGIVPGRIVAPRGTGFGWDLIFVPDGHERTFGEMSKDEKNAISMRRLAAEKLKEFIRTAA